MQGANKEAVIVSLVLQLIISIIGIATSKEY